jgi:hypothetical protein
MNRILPGDQIMKQAILVAFALLAACHEEPAEMSFGLNIRLLESGDVPSEGASSSCIPPGGNTGEVGSFGAWDIGEPPPHLFVEADPDAEEDVYRVRVFIASERDADGIWWIPSEVLAERSYDSAFGESGALDSIVVDFKGEPYTIDVLGLPTAECP